MIRLIFLFFWLFSPPLFARSALHQMRYTALPDRVQITLETDSLPVFSHFGIDNPPRVVIDLQQTRSYTNDLKVGQGEVQGVRSGPKGDEDLRLVIDLHSPAPVNVYPRNGKITIDIFNNLGSRPAPSPPAATPVAGSQPAPLGPWNSSPTPSPRAYSYRETMGGGPGPTVPPQPNPTPAPLAFSPTPTPPAAFSPTPTPRPGANANAFAAIQRPSPLPRRPDASKTLKQEVQWLANKRDVVVVIDPGHGGKDPGAVSAATGIREKDVVLQIAQRLKRNLDSKPGFKVFLTRDADFYIPLKERVEIARRHKADLFVSIHADAANSESSGSSVYMLSTKGASSELAKQLENSENAVALRWDSPGKRYDSDLQEMLLNLQQEGTLESSHLLAERTLQSLGQVNNLSRRDVEQANFVVLRAPDIPSILVETAFLSNPNEAQLLATPEFQQKLADSIALGIERFFREHLPQHLLLKK